MTQIKVFGARQQINHEELLVKFLGELVANPPESPKKMEQRKCDFAGENKIAANIRVKQRLNTATISHKEQFFAAKIVDSKRKHATKFMNAIRPPR